MSRSAVSLNDDDEDEVYEKRKAAGITRVFKMVDTCSAEFEAKTPYFYSTFEAQLKHSRWGRTFIQ